MNNEKVADLLSQLAAELKSQTPNVDQYFMEHRDAMWEKVRDDLGRADRNYRHRSDESLVDYESAEFELNHENKIVLTSVDIDIDSVVDLVFKSIQEFIEG